MLNIVLYSIPVSVFLIDQLSKHLCLSSLSIGVAHRILPILNFTLQFNKGAAFSFLSEAGGWQRWFFLIMTVIICLGILFWLRQAKTVFERYAFLLILGGALGNACDRLLYGHVVDFIDLHYKGWHFATFNIADMAICLGACFFFYSMLVHSKMS